jgi:uncharacterized protein YutE (UPF0331/DUF86 family)
MSLNADLVRARCAEIEESVRRLEEFQRLPRDPFLANRDTLDIVSYRLLVAIEAALAICYHVTAQRLRKVPEGYAECFGILHEAGMLPADLAGRLQKMARFRNLLIHRYWDVDYGIVYDVVQQDLGDLRAFAAVAARLV